MESKFIEFIKNKTIEEIDDSLINSSDSELLYKLSLRRANFLSIINFNSDDEVLEILDSEIITHSYLDKVKSVTKFYITEIDNALYGDKILSHNDNNKYSKIIVNKFDDLENDLKYLKTILKENGQIIICVNNKYSLSSLSGKKNYSEKEYFETVLNKNNYSKKELQHIFAKVGLGGYFYYPLPDYNFAQTIFSEDYLPSPSDIKNIEASYNEYRYVLFDEEKALIEALKNDEFDTFTSSFIVVLG